jgi:alpha-2-macroglobulin
VKVIGSNNSEFTSGETDLRGVFIADAIAGTSTVIAQAEGGKYAFFRGTTRLGQAEADRAATPERPQAGAQRKATSSKELLKNVFKGQIDASRSNSGKLKKLYDNKAQGVQVEQAK